MGRAGLNGRSYAVGVVPPVLSEESDSSEDSDGGLELPAESSTSPQLMWMCQKTRAVWHPLSTACYLSVVVSI